MIVKRIVRNDDGNIEATLMLTPEQASFMMNVGLGVLVQKGVAEVVDYTEEEFLAQTQEKLVQGEVLEEQPATTVTSEQKPALNEAKDKAQKQFLQDVDISILPKA